MPCFHILPVMYFPLFPDSILALLVGAAVAAIFGVLIGIPVLRLRGDYLAIVTLAFGEIIKNLINILYVGVDDNGIHIATSAANLKLDPGGKQIIKGALGVSGTATLYKDIKEYFFLIGVILVLLALFIIQNLVNSRSGRAITSTRDNRIAAESIGINVTKNKLLAFTVSAAIAGVAGVLYAHNLSMLKGIYLRLQYVHHHFGIRHPWWYGKSSWKYYCNHRALCTSGAASWLLHISYADLCDRYDRNDAFQLGSCCKRFQKPYC